MNEPPAASLEISEAAEPTRRVQHLVSDGYRLLAELHEAVDGTGADPTLAHEHLANATRELAAIQKMFERRGR